MHNLFYFRNNWWMGDQFRTMLNLPELIRLITGEKKRDELLEANKPKPRPDTCGFARKVEGTMALYKCESQRSCGYKIDFAKDENYCRKMLMMGMVIGASIIGYVAPIGLEWLSEASRNAPMPSMTMEEKIDRMYWGMEK